MHPPGPCCLKTQLLIILWPMTREQLWLCYHELENQASISIRMRSPIAVASAQHRCFLTPESTRDKYLTVRSSTKKQLELSCTTLEQKNSSSKSSVVSSVWPERSVPSPCTLEAHPSILRVQGLQAPLALLLSNWRNVCNQLAFEPNQRLYYPRTHSPLLYAPVSAKYVNTARVFVNKTHLTNN